MEDQNDIREFAKAHEKGRYSGNRTKPTTHRVPFWLIANIPVIILILIVLAHRYSEYKDLKAQGYEPVLGFKAPIPPKEPPSREVPEKVRPITTSTGEKNMADGPEGISLTEKRLRELAEQERAKPQRQQPRLIAGPLNAETGAVATYTDYMASLVANSWERPPSARRGMAVTLEIILGSGGKITSVTPVMSSGNNEFDASAAIAVWKVGQFKKLKEMDPGLYQREFRKIYLVFRPDDLRM